MEITKTITALIKVGQTKHMIDFLKNGTIYANTIAYFREYAIDANRGDFAEGAHSSITINLKQINIGSFELPVTSKDSYISFYDDSCANSHLFSLYLLAKEDYYREPLIDPKICGFGNSAVIIKNPKKFIERLEFSKAKYGMSYDMVTYYNTNQNHHNLTPFDKRHNYQYQNELRLLFSNNSTEPLKFEIGSIEDIAEIIESKGLLNVKRIYE